MWSFSKPLFNIRLLSAVSFKCIILKLLQTEPGLGTTQSTVCVLWQKQRQTEHPEKLSNKVRTNLCRDPVSLYFSKSLRGILGHPRNARMGEMVQKARLLTKTRQWAQREFEMFDFHIRSSLWVGGIAAVLIRGPFVSPEKRGSV